MKARTQTPQDKKYTFLVTLLHKTWCVSSFSVAICNVLFF